MKNKIISVIPYIIVVAILTYWWIYIITGVYAPTVQHYIALGLVLLNGVLYLKNYKWAILFTGAMLVLATFNLFTFYAVTKTFSITIAGFKLPEIQYFSFFILIGYCVINYILLVDWYLDYKESKAK